MVITGKHIGIAAALLILCIVCGFALWYYLRPDNEQLIRKQFAELTALSRKTGKESLVSAMTKAKSLANLFTEKSMFAIDGLPWIAGPYSRERLSGDILRSRTLFNTMKLSCDDLEIEFNEEQSRGIVLLSVVLTGNMKSGKSLREVRELEVILEKTEGKWLFDSFRIRQLIKK